MEQDEAYLRERAAEADRLSKLMAFAPPEEWRMEGARVISQRLGPASALETILVDKGSRSNFGTNTPVVAPEGIIGRVLRTSPNASTVLLLTDLNSGIAIIGQSSRSVGILTGQGAGKPLRVQYVPQNVPLEEGEILISAGSDGIFPKGLPVAKVAKAEKSKNSLFQNVEAQPLVELKGLEEVLLLKRADTPQPDSAQEKSLMAPEPQRSMGGRGPSMHKKK